jgi:hypothetical protein
MGIDYRALSYLGFRVSDDDLTSQKVLALAKALDISLDLTGEESAEDVGAMLADETYRCSVEVAPFTPIDSGDDRDGWFVGIPVGRTGGSRGSNKAEVPAPKWSTLADAHDRIVSVAVAAGFDQSHILLLTQLRIS